MQIIILHYLLQIIIDFSFFHIFDIFKMEGVIFKNNFLGHNWCFQLFFIHLPLDLSKLLQVSPLSICQFLKELIKHEISLLMENVEIFILISMLHII